MSMGKKGPERRRHLRVSVGGRTKGKVNAVHDVSIQDISLGGMLIEHVQVVQPGTICDLVCTLRAHKMRLRCQVIRATVHHSERDLKGKQKLIYRTGLEFLELSDETRQVIRDYITSIIEEEDGGGSIEQNALAPLEQGGLQITEEMKPKDKA